MKQLFRMSALVMMWLMPGLAGAQDDFEVFNAPPGSDALPFMRQKMIDAPDLARIRFNLDFDGDLDGYILIGDDTDIDGAYLPANYQQEFEFVAPGQNVIIDGNGLDIPLISAGEDSVVRIFGVTIRNFNNTPLSFTGNATLDMFRTQLVGNSSPGYGGGVFADDNAHIISVESQVFNSTAVLGGGGMALLGNATAAIFRCIMSGNHTGGPGRDIFMTGSNRDPLATDLYIEGCQFSGPVGSGASILPETGSTAGVQINLVTKSGSNGIDPRVRIDLMGSNFWDEDSFGPQLQLDNGDSKPEVLCGNSEGLDFRSLGYNTASDDSCNLDQPTDRTNTDPMLEANGLGIYVPEPGSQAIDSGPTEAFIFSDDLETLPCGYKDLLGLGRPQDANNDGVFECDRGATEVPFPYTLTPGHSAAFFNFLRNGEGQYVEMLNANTAVVYTFTQRPDGGGSMWFIGVGYVLGNSIVIDQLLRPTGTSFGDGFVAEDITNEFVGGQSMVFNDCEATSPGGSVAFSGNHAVGLEALMTRAQRLSNILGCGDITPHPNAGLSGSYFLPARNGEGIVVQWLPDGQVLVIFFTYDLENNQQWVIGIGQSDGFSVTMDALYASGNSEWGSDYNQDDVVLTPWGTFELTWTECGGVQFSYNSTVSGYGSATRPYQRLSTLWDTTCPGF